MCGRMSDVWRRGGHRVGWRGIAALSIKPRCAVASRLVLARRRIGAGSSARRSTCAAFAAPAAVNKRAKRQQTNGIARQAASRIRLASFIK